MDDELPGTHCPVHMEVPAVPLAWSCRVVFRIVPASEALELLEQRDHAMVALHVCW
jgi:hypothetical protein